MKHKLLFTAMLGVMAASYGVESVTEYFEPVPTITQKLQDKIVEQDTFLKKINVMPVDEIKGEKVLGSASGILGKRTNTETNDRVPQNVLALGDQDYELFSTEFDVYIKYATIDSWAKFPDFQERYAKWVRQAIAMARVRVGWYGTQAAAVTNAVTYPNGEDVNKGWLQKMREYNSGAQWFVEGAEEDEIRIGAGGDFENLDAAVHACLMMIDPIHRESGKLVAFVGVDLLSNEKERLYNAQGQTPTEKEKIANEKVTKTYGGLPVDTPSGFPARGIFITSYDNLSLYYQITGWRRKIEDNAKRNRVEDFNSSNEGYIVENEEAAAGFEFANVKIKDGADWV
jgi:P2 family phage major capsid protein